MRTLRLALPIVALLLAATVTPGLALEPPVGSAVAKLDLSTPAAATTTFFEAIKANDLATVEKALSPRFKEGLAKEKQTTADLVKDIAGELGTVISIANEPLEISDAKATVAVTAKHPTKGLKVEKIRLAKVGDQWLVDM